MLTIILLEMEASMDDQVEVKVSLTLTDDIESITVLTGPSLCFALLWCFCQLTVLNFDKYPKGKQVL